MCGARVKGEGVPPAALQTESEAQKGGLAPCSGGLVNKRSAEVEEEEGGRGAACRRWHCVLYLEKRESRKGARVSRAG